jgi:predicted ArsR family transcriptional regulator
MNVLRCPPRLTALGDHRVGACSDGALGLRRGHDHREQGRVGVPCQVDRTRRVLERRDRGRSRGERGRQQVERRGGRNGDGRLGREPELLAKRREHRHDPLAIPRRLARRRELDVRADGRASCEAHGLARRLARRVDRHAAQPQHAEPACTRHLRCQRRGARAARHRCEQDRVVDSEQVAKVSSHEGVQSTNAGISNTITVVYHRCVRSDSPRPRASAARIERALGDAPAGLTMRELVSLTGLHENAIRRTLVRLTGSGSVHVESERRPARGRPALRYRRAGAADEPFRRFLPFLLELLQRASVTSEDAFELGRAQGAGMPSAAAVGAPDAVAGLLVRLGFDPARNGAGTDGAVRLTLRRCPFSEIVASSRGGHRVCALHHGLIAGVAAASGGELQSFTVNDPPVVPCELEVR